MFFGEYTIYLLLLLIVILNIILIYLISNRASFHENIILEKASGKEKIKQEHIKIALSLHRATISSPSTYRKEDLDQYAMILLGYGEIFKYAVQKKTFTVREIATEFNFPLETVRKWINECKNMKLLARKESPHGFMIYELKPDNIKALLGRLRDKIIDLIGFRRPVTRENLSLDDSFEFLRTFLTWLMPIKNVIRTILLAEEIRMDELERFGLQPSVARKWLMIASRNNLIIQAGNETFQINHEEIANFVNRFLNAIETLIQSL